MAIFWQYLNCDEQYLPDAFKSVHEFFERIRALKWCWLARSSSTEMANTFVIGITWHRIHNTVGFVFRLLPVRFFRWRVIHEWGIY